jgi:hypothetical protein
MQMATDFDEHFFDVPWLEILEWYERTCGHDGGDPVS